MTTAHITRSRRRYVLGSCQDCGRYRNTTLIHFWVNNMPMRVCAECIRPYRGSILKPCSCEE